VESFRNQLETKQQEEAANGIMMRTPELSLKGGEQGDLQRRRAYRHNSSPWHLFSMRDWFINAILARLLAPPTAI